MMSAEFSEVSEEHISNIPSAAGQQDPPPAGAAAFVNGARLLLVALWLGAALYFSFAVAPSAFAILPTRELAGALVTRTLAVVNIAGLLVALAVLLTWPFAGRVVERFAQWAEPASLLVLALTTAAGQWVIAARLRAMREQMPGGIDSLAPGDPLRVAFNDLHGYSVAALGVGMLAALAALLLIARRRP